MNWKPLVWEGYGRANVLRLLKWNEGGLKWIGLGWAGRPLDRRAKLPYLRSRMNRKIRHFSLLQNPVPMPAVQWLS
jgi:hypothetical protein